MTTTTIQDTYPDAPTSLTGRSYVTRGGEIATVGERGPTNMYRVTFSRDGRTTCIRPSIIMEALAASEG